MGVICFKTKILPMASYMSILDSQPEYQSPVNLALLDKVMSGKQQKFDKNLAEIDQTLAELKVQENLLIRTEDKQRFANTTQSLIDTMNRSGKMDVSSDGLKRQITGQIKTVLDDDYLVEQIGNSQKIRSAYTQAQELQKKNDGKFAAVNFDFALAQAGVDKYIAGETNEVGQISYHNFTDYNKKINDFIIDLEGKKKDQTIQIPDGRGGMIEKTISGLSPMQLRSVAESMIDTNDRKQIEIDAWYNSGGYKNPAVTENASSYIDYQVDNFDQAIENINRQISAGGLSPKELEQAEAQIETASRSKTNLLKNKDILKADPRAAATYLEQEKVFSGIVNRFSGLYTESAKVVKDEVFWAQKNYDLDERKLLLNVAEFEYKQNKDALEQQEAMTGGAGIITLTDGIADTEALNVESLENEIDTTIGTISTQLDREVLEYKSAVDGLASEGDKDAQTIQKAFNTRLKNKKANQTEADIFRATVLELDNTNDRLNIIGNKNYKANIKALTDDLDLYTAGRLNAESKAKTNHVDTTINTQETFKAYYDNPNTKMLWNGKATPVKDVLIAQGLMDRQGNKIGDIKTKGEVLKSLEQSYYADAFLSKKYKGDYLKKLANSLGENISNVVVDRNKPGVRADINGINLNSKTGQFLQQARQQGVYDTFDFSDQSLSNDDGTINRFLNTDYKKSPDYSNSLRSFRAKLPNSQTIGIPNTQKALHANVMALATSANPAFNPVADKTINIKDEGDYVYLYQSDSVKKGGEVNSIPQQARVLKADFKRNLPELSARIDFDSKSAIYTQEKLAGKPLLSQSVKYIQDSANPNFEWAAEVLLKDQPQFVPYLTNTDSKQTILRNNSTLVKQRPEVAQVINTAIDSSSDYSIKIELSQGFTTPKMYLKMVDKTTKQEIHSLKIDNFTDADNFKPILDEAPQVYYSMLVNDILKKQTASQALGSDYQSYTKLIQSLNN